MGAHIELRGNLGQDPKLGQTKNGKHYLQFSVYQSHWVPNSNNGFDDRGGFWMECVWFHAGAESGAQMLKKGSPVVVSGDLRLEVYKDQNGNDRQRFKCNVKTLGMAILPPKRNEANNGSGNTASQHPQTVEVSHSSIPDSEAGADNQIDEFADSNIPF